MSNKSLFKKGAGRLLALVLAASLAFPGTVHAASPQDSLTTASEEYVEEDLNDSASPEETTDNASTPQTEDTDDRSTTQTEDTDDATTPQTEDTDDASTPQAEDTDDASVPQAEDTNDASVPQTEDTDDASVPQTEDTDGVPEGLTEETADPNASEADKGDNLAGSLDSAQDVPEANAAEEEDKVVPDEEAGQDLAGEEDVLLEESENSDILLPEVVVNEQLAQDGDDYNLIESIQFDTDKYYIYLGLKGQTTYQTKLKITYATTDKAENQSYKFVSSDESVVTVSSEGLVKAVGTGHAEVSVYLGPEFEFDACSLSFYVYDTAYLVTYDLNGGKLASGYSLDSEEIVTDGSSIYLPSRSMFEKSGYVLKGWSTDKSGKTLLSYSYTPIKNSTLYAIWAKAYTVKYNANGGTFSKYFDTSVTVEAGESIYLDTGTYVGEKKGYLLTGWSTTKNGSNVKTTNGNQYTPTKNTTLYAVWSKAYTITFNANGGTLNTEKSRLIAAGTSIYLSTGKYGGEKKGYILDGWTLKGGTKVYRNSVTPTKNTTFYAHWVKSVNVTLNAGKGYFDANKKTTKKTVAVAKGSTAGKVTSSESNSPECSGKTFVAWYKDAKLTKPVRLSDVISKNTTFYAKYKTNSIRVTVTNLKGANYTNRNTQKYVTNSKDTSYSFTIAAGSSIGNLYIYKNGLAAKLYFDKSCKEKPFYSGLVPSGNITVYAKWLDGVTIKWDGNGGTDYSGQTSGSTNSLKTQMCDSLPDEMYKDEYYFIGWYDIKNTKKILPASHVFTKNTTVKAKWGKGVKVTFKGNGATSHSDRMVYYVKANTTLERVPYVRKDGYILKGWKNSVTGKVVTSAYGQKITKATTFTAVWTKESNPVKVSVLQNSGEGSMYDEEDGEYRTKVTVYVPKNTAYKNVGVYLNYSNYDSDPTKNMTNYGWSLTKNGSELPADYKFTKNVTIYALYKTPDPWVTVALVTNGGSVNNYAANTPLVRYVRKGESIALPTSKDMEREGYSFGGWYSDYKCTKKIANPSKYQPTKSCYLYAKWNKK